MIYIPTWGATLITLLAFAFGAYLGCISKYKTPAKEFNSQVNVSDNCDENVSCNCDAPVGSNAKKP